MARGVPQSYFVDEFASQGVMLEGVAGPPDYLAMAAPYTGPPHRELMLQYRNIAQFGVMISDTSRGHVPLNRFARRAGLVRYDVNQRDTARVQLGDHQARGDVLRRRRAPCPRAAGPRARAARRRPDPSTSLTLRASSSSSWRSTRSAPHERRRRRRRTASRARQNVYVADGSAVPTALGVNPQLTIMALATRLAFQLLGRPVTAQEDPHVVSHRPALALRQRQGARQAAREDAQAGRRRDAWPSSSVTSISLYLNRRWTKPIWEACQRRRRARLDAQLGRVQVRPPQCELADARRERRDLRHVSLLAVVGIQVQSMSAQTRFTGFDAAQGGYESYYLRAVDPERPRGVWLRHTVHRRPGTAAGRLDLADALRRRRPTGRWRSSVTVPGPDAGRRGLASRSATARSAPDGVAGHAGRRARRELRGTCASTASRRCATCPREWMYGAPLPRTKLHSPHPALRYSGTVTHRRQRGRARRLAGDGRPQLGRPARRALDLAARHAFDGRARTPGSTSRSGGSRSAR